MKYYIFLILLVGFGYSNSLQNQFVWDDYLLIIDNPKINISLEDIPSIFANPLWKSAGFAEVTQYHYRPIVYLFFVLNYKIWGPNPLGFHLANIILHLISVVVLYKTALLVFNNNKIISIIGTSIFAVHPIHNEPVGRVASGDPIFGFFIILAIYLFLKEKKPLSCLTFSLALLAKEPAVMLPFALLIPAIHKKGFKKGMLTIIPYIVLVGIYIILRLQTVDIVLGLNLSEPIFAQFLTMIVAILDYIKLLLIPYPLNPFYPARWYKSLFELKVLIAMTVLVIVSLLIFKIRKDKKMLFLLAFPFIMLAPVVWRVNTYPVEGDLVYIAERFLYVPAMLFSLFVSAFVIEAVGENKKRYIMIGWVSIVIVFIIITISANMLWRNDISLSQRIISYAPDASFAHNNLGFALAKQGKINEAIKEYTNALRLNPNNAKAHNNLGVVYTTQGRLDEAVNEYQIAINLNRVEAHNNLGLVYAGQGRFDEAVKEYLIVLRNMPDFIPILATHALSKVDLMRL